MKFLHAVICKGFGQNATSLRAGRVFFNLVPREKPRNEPWHPTCDVNTEESIPMTTRKKSKRKWSAEVTKHSDAMDLKKNVFKQSDPKKIAKSVKASATRSTRRKASPKRSAMSMISFYENRAGKNLSPARRKKLDRAKDELRKLPK